MKVRSAYTLKTFKELKQAQEYAKKINKGAGVHADCDLEIHYNPKARKQVSLGGPSSALKQAMGGLAVDSEEDDETGNKWSVVVVDSEQIPGGATCAECEKTHFADDYLCPECRENS